MYERGNGDLTDGQINYLKKLASQIEKGKEPVDGRSEEEGAPTPAERILRFLEENDISHIALYDEPESELLSIRKPREKRKAPVKVVTRLPTGEFRSETVDVDSFLDSNSTLKEVESLHAYRERERSRLMVHGNGRQRLLLSVAWVTDSQRQMFARFPEVVGGDVTMQTNREARPLWNLAGKTASNQTFTALNAFLPSQSRWSFDWIYRFALPRLLPVEALARIQIFLTDGDDKEYEPFVQLLHNLYPQARHGLCMFHLIERGLLRKKIYESRLDDEGKKTLKALKQWMWSWSRDVESDAEFAASYHLFLHWLSLPHIVRALTPANVAAVKSYLCTSMLPLRAKWVNTTARHHTRTFQQRTTNHVESENSVLKSSSTGPKPNSSIDKSAESIANLNNARLRKKKRKASASLDELPTQRVVKGLHGIVDGYAADLVLAQYDARTSFSVIKAENSTFWVRQFLFKKNEDQVTPRFWRTRVVKLLEEEGKTFTVCSCGLHTRMGLGCRHIYAILDRPPNANDLIVRWHLGYALYHMEDTELTDIYRDILKREPPGIQLTDDEVGDIAAMGLASEDEKAKFEPQLSDRAPVIRPYSFWAIHPGGLQSLRPSLDTGGVQPGARVALPGLVSEVHLSAQASAEVNGIEGIIIGEDAAPAPTEAQLLANLRVHTNNLIPGIHSMGSKSQESHDLVASTLTELWRKLVLKNTNGSPAAGATLRNELESEHPHVAAMAAEQKDTREELQSATGGAADLTPQHFGDAGEGAAGWASSNLESDTARESARWKPIWSPTRKR